MRGLLNIRLIIAVVLALAAVFSYWSRRELNPYTGEEQHISLNTEQEIALGLQAAPELARQHGGMHPDPQHRAVVERVGRRLVDNTLARQSPYPFKFHLLADPRSINAFALPGGQVFITWALYHQLENEDQLAGVLGHEIGHVLARHSAQRIAQQELAQGLTGAAVMATYDPSNPNSAQSAQMAQMISNLVLMKYGREEELESDELGVRFMIEAGYNPEALIGVMRILEQAGGGQGQPEFMSTHPSPENRVQRIREAIQKYSSRP